MSSRTEATSASSEPRWFAIILILLIFCLVGVETGVVMRARAALIDPRAVDAQRIAQVMSMLPPIGRFDQRAPARLVPDPGVMIERMVAGPVVAFDLRPGPRFERPDPDRLIAAMLGPPDNAFDLKPAPRLVNLDPSSLIREALGGANVAFDWHPAPRIERPDPNDLVLAMLTPETASFDDRPRPHFAYKDPVALMIALLPNVREALDIAPLPDLPGPPPALDEPFMDVREGWVGRWRKLHPDPFQRVHFAGNVISRCLPKTLLRVLADVAQRFGEVKVISGYRSPDHNRRVGGATRSMHLECRAIDFYVAGRNGGLLSYLAGRREVGGYARYPFGSYHIDNGPRRTW